MMSHPLLPKLRQLKLSGMLNTLDVRVSQAVDQQLAPLEFLALLLDDELERRNQNRLILKLALSGCDSNKTMAHFDFSTAPGINRTLIQDLASCVFIQRHENLLMCGPTGVGKSHLANAIAIEAVKCNFRVLTKPTHRLLQDLQIARANGSYPASSLVPWLTTCSSWTISVCNPFLPRLSRTSTRSLPNVMNAAP